MAGAGVAGLAAATAMAQRGYTVQVAERAPSIAEVGAGIQISPNGFAVLRALGVADELKRRAIRLSEVRLIDGLTGRRVATLDLARHRPNLAWFAVHRAALIDVLLEGAMNSDVQIDVDREIIPPEDGAPLKGDDLLIGADGVHSVVRGASREPFFTGQVAWRALIPEPTDTEPVVEVHMGPGCHLVTYPLAGGLRNIVAVREQADWAVEGWNEIGDPAELRDAFSGFKTDVLNRVAACHLWGLFRHPVAERWYNGAQVIMGDAAHPTLPFLAQGANLALEDAWLLAKYAPALDKYEALRRPRVSRAIAAANANARNYHLSGVPRYFGHNLLRALGWVAPAAMLGRFDWLYAHDVTQD